MCGYGKAIWLSSGQCIPLPFKRILLCILVWEPHYELEGTRKSDHTLDFLARTGEFEVSSKLRHLVLLHFRQFLDASAYEGS